MSEEQQMIFSSFHICTNAIERGREQKILDVCERVSCSVYA